METKTSICLLSSIVRCPYSSLIFIFFPPCVLWKNTRLLARITCALIRLYVFLRLEHALWHPDCFTRYWNLIRPSGQLNQAVVSSTLANIKIWFVRIKEYENANFNKFFEQPCHTLRKWESSSQQQEEERTNKHETHIHHARDNSGAAAILR